MKKRILACLLMMCMLVTMVPATAFAAEDVAPTDEPQQNEAVCICDALCTEGTVNTDCPVCGGEVGYTACTYTTEEPQQDEAVCICDALCTEETVNMDCPVCGGEAGFAACTYTAAEPQEDGNSTPWTELTPAEPVDIPAHAPMNNSNVYEVDSAETLNNVIDQIANSESDEATIVLTADLRSGSRKATTEDEKKLVGGSSPEKKDILGVVGKHITFTSAENQQYTLGISWTYLVGDVTFDRVKMAKSGDVFANGFCLEFTENFEGSCSGYVYGGSNRRAVDSTHLIFNAGSFGNGGTGYGIYGGGYAGGMGRPTGPSLGLDGEPGMPGWTPPEFKAGTGDVNGDVCVEIGGTATLTYLFGGSRNGNVKGNVHITLQSDSADARTVGWIAGAGYGNQKGYGNVMGDVTIDALSGNVAYITGTGNQAATDESGIELGDIDSVAGDVNITVGQNSGTPMYIRQSGGGSNLLAGCGKPMTIANGGVTVCGDVNITLNKTAQLDDGDTSALYYGTVFGVHSNSAVCGSVNIVNNGATLRDMIGAADGAQILGNGRGHALKIVMNDGELLQRAGSTARGYIRPYKSAYGGGGETQIKNDVIFEVNGGTLWGAEATEKSKDTFTIDGDFTAVITTTTKNGLVTAVGGQVGTELTDGHKSTAVFTGGKNILIDNVINFDEVIVKDNTTARLRAVNDEDGGTKPYPFAKDDGIPTVKDVTIEAGSILALYKEGEITGNLTVNGTLALARNYNGVVAPMTAHGTASGNGSLRPISTSTSLLMKSAPKYLEKYVYAQAVDSSMTLSLDSSNNKQYFVDRKASTINGQDVWFINENQTPQEVTVTFDKNGGDTEADPNRMTVPSGSTVDTLPKAPTRENYTFKGWNTVADGSGEKFTATTSVTSDITVYAQWERNTTPVDPKVAAYRVEHYQEQLDGSYTLSTTEFPLYGEIGATVTAVPKTYEHYHVNHEKSTMTGTVKMPSTGTDGTLEILTLQVYYDLDTVTVSYDLNGGTGKDGISYAPETVKYGASVTIKDAPSKSGYTFEGWSDGTTTHQPGDVLTVLGNITLTAQWHKNSSGGSTGGGGSTYYILHYESNGGTEYKDERYKKNTVVELDKVPTREGYTFTGWYADEELTDRITSIKMTSDKTVYAGWEPTGVPDWLNGKDHFAYVVGYVDGTVRPLNNISRAEVATIFFRLLNEDIREENLTSANTFADVNDGMWCNMAISTMAKLGVVKGRSTEHFDPNAPITRAEFAAICARFDTSKRTGDSDFTDITGHWAEAEIERAASLGWIMGYTDGTFRPENYITRAEAMTMINRVLNRLPEDKEDLLDGMNVWPDNQPDAWYYLAVQEATNSHDFTRKGDVHEHWTKLNADPDWSQYQ